MCAGKKAIAPQGSSGGTIFLLRLLRICGSVAFVEKLFKQPITLASCRV